MKKPIKLVSKVTGFIDETEIKADLQCEYVYPEGEKCPFKREEGEKYCSFHKGVK